MNTGGEMKPIITLIFIALWILLTIHVAGNFNKNLNSLEEKTTKLNNLLKGRK